jgi:hypothetical protein
MKISLTSAKVFSSRPSRSLSGFASVDVQAILRALPIDRTCITFV